jgi:hypothetical protein
MRMKIRMHQKRASLLFPVGGMNSLFFGGYPEFVIDPTPGRPPKLLKL